MLVRKRHDADQYDLCGLMKSYIIEPKEKNNVIYNHEKALKRMGAKAEGLFTDGNCVFFLNQYSKTSL